MGESVETVVVGGGQAGLATSYCLKRRGREHVVLEQADGVGSAWRDGRWDSFTLVTPNWTFRLPGGEYAGEEPHGYMPRDEIVATFQRYAENNALPVRYGTHVLGVERDQSSGAYRVRAEGAEFAARNVVVATGLYQRPKVPSFSADLPVGVRQLASGAYRAPGVLPDGSVLVVGSAQSGAQIADELYRSGRSVYLCVGGAGRVPRRYRGRDIVDWMNALGMFDRGPADLPTPRAKFAPNPHVTGRDGGRTLNLHQYARDGVTLLGHLRGADDRAIYLAPDLHESLAKADRFEADLAQLIDRYIRTHDVDAPEERLPNLRDGYDVPQHERIDLRDAGITTVIWAIGYDFDFDLVRLPVFDADGFPVQQHGATEFPGLYFVGLPYLVTRKSGLLLGVGEDAEYVAAAIDGEQAGRDHPARRSR